MEVSGQPRAQAALPSDKQPLILTVEEAEWTPERVWTIWKREKSLAHAPGIKPQIVNLSERILVAVRT
jgi:hypothetical protein